MAPRQLEQWEAYLNGMELDFSHPGKPTTGDALSVVAKWQFRQECLNEKEYLSQ